MTLKEMAKAMQGTMLRGISESVPSGVSIDTRTLRKGELFFAIRGPHFDGHDFFADAAAKGALAAVVEKGFPNSPAAKGKGLEKLPLLGVDDTTLALGRLGRAYQTRWPCVAVGVTGSAGKTTTKELARAVFTAKYRVLASEGNLNNVYGVPLTLARRTERHDAIVCEMGISTPGEMALLAAVYLPDIMIFTCIAAAHLEFFGSIDGIFAEKTSVLAEMKKDSVAVANGDDLFLRRIKETPDFWGGRTLLYGASEGCDVLATRIESRGFEGSSCDAVFPDGKKLSFALALPGRANAMNALAAATAAWAAGVPPDAMAERLALVKPLAGRGIVHNLRGGIRVVDDTYNANPASFRAALDSLGATPCAGRRAVLAGDMLELGAGERKLHEATGRTIGACGVDAVFATGASAEWLTTAARKSGVPDVRVFETARNAGEAAAEWAHENDILLAKGSRGMHMEEAVAALREKLGRKAA